MGGRGERAQGMHRQVNGAGKGREGEGVVVEVRRH